MNIRELNELLATRKHFEEFKMYTKLLPQSSQWIKFWKEERRRCIEGYHIGSDYIPGYFYDYLNYTPILKSEVVKQESNLIITGNLQADRIEGFPNYWDGDYDWFNYVDEAEKMGEHAFLGGSRGKGKSVKAGSMLNRNYFHIEKSKSYAFAYSLEFLTGDGIITKAWDVMDFRDSHTPWGKRRQYKNTDLHRRASFQEIDSEGLKIEKGWKSEIIGVTVGDDIDKVRGKRGKLIILEEAGNFRKLNTGWNILRPSMEDGKRTFGLILGVGTGGSEGAASAGFEELFRNPRAYRIHPVTNKWEAGRENTECAFFWSGAINFAEAYDEITGESHVDTATNMILEDRKMVALGSDPHAVIRRKAEIPLTPSEMLMRISGTQFPIGLLKEQEAEVFTKPHIYLDADYICKFELNRETQKYEFKLDFDSTPLLKFPHADNKNMPGAIVIYKKRITENPPFGRYVGGCLVPGEKVLTEKGLMNIEEVTLENKLVNENGDFVSINKLMETPVVDKDIYTIKLSNTFRTTTFTEEHPILNRSNIKTGRNQNFKDDFNFVTADSLKVNSWVKIPNLYKQLKNIDLDSLWNNEFIENKYHNKDFSIKNPLTQSDFWWIIGLWLGDGWLHSNNDKIEICFNINERIYIDKCKNIINKYLDRNVWEYTKDNLVKITFCSKQFHSFLLKYFGKYSYGKKIEEWVKFLNSDIKKELIKGYLASDGCIYQDRNKYYGTSFVSINLELLESIQDILFSLGHISRLSKLRNAGTYKFPQGYTSNTKECYQLALGHNDTINFARSIYDETDIKLNRIDWNNLPITRIRPKQGCYLEGDFIYFQIKDIQKGKFTGLVYNFDCETHTYLAHHITTHNCDSYDFDESTTTSLGSLYIADTFTGEIVAEYTGRPEAKIFYENCRQLLLYYNAQANIENSNKGIFDYFDSKNCGYLIVEELNIVREATQDNGKTGHRRRGFTPSKPLNAYARGLIAQWLKESTNVEDKPEELRVHTFRCLPAIQEMILWNIDGNFDRVSALGALMLIYYDKIKFSPEDRFTEEPLDDFFIRNYKGKQNSYLLNRNISPPNNNLIQF
jgi:intein/homing endonuclease